MATKKKSTPKKSSSKTTPSTSPTLPSFSLPSNLSPKFLSTLLIVILIGTSVFFLAKRYRGLVIAGVVNKTPITRWELNDVLSRRYGAAVLEELTNNKLLSQEAAKQDITITQEDMDAERVKLVESLGGEENLGTALVQYGLSEEDLADQLRLRLIQERLAEKLFDVEVTQEEIEAYFESNATLFEGKELVDVETEIRETLKQQSLQQEFLAWFDQAKQDAQITTYLD